jgi:hypothetical protein
MELIVELGGVGYLKTERRKEKKCCTVILSISLLIGCDMSQISGYRAAKSNMHAEWTLE